MSASFRTSSCSDTMRSRDAARVSGDAFRRAMAQVPTSVTVVTTRTVDGHDVGMTVNSFTSVSLDPPLVLWAVRLNSYSYNAFREASRFAVSVLSENQGDVAMQFSRSRSDKFAGVAIRKGVGNVPLIADSVASFECLATGMHLAGDHAIFIGLVQHCEASEACRPLVFHRGLPSPA